VADGVEQRRSGRFFCYMDYFNRVKRQSGREQKEAEYVTAKSGKKVGKKID